MIFLVSKIKERAFLVAAYAGYARGGEKLVIKVTLIFVLALFTIYAVGKKFGSKDPNKTFDDILVSGMLRVSIAFFVLAFPLYLIGLVGIADLRRPKCEPNPPAYDNGCEPDRYQPQRWEEKN